MTITPLDQHCPNWQLHPILTIQNQLDRIMERSHSLWRKPEAAVRRTPLTVSMIANVHDPDWIE